MDSTAIKLFIFITIVGSLGFTVRHYKNAYEEAKDRYEKAEAAVAVMKEEKDKLAIALEAQEQATAEAQMNKKVVYRTIQKEVAKDEKARDWYGSPVPASLVRVLQNGGTNHD